MGLVERFVGAAVGQRALVLVFVAALAVTGTAALWNLPVEAFPDLTNNQVVVITEAPSLGAPEVEQQVSYPIETALMGVPDAEEVRSVSKFGLSLVTVVFDDAVPMYLARQLVTERLTEVRGQMPAGLEPTLGPPATAFGEIYQYVVTGDDPMANKTVHDWEVRTRLRSVAGVSEVNSWGGLTQQFEVVVRPEALEEFDLTLRDVFHAIGDSNRAFSGGFIEARDERYTVRGIGLLTGIQDLERVVVRADEGVPVLLADIAEVGLGAMQRSGAVTAGGEGEVASGMVVMLKGENALEVSDLVKERMSEILPGLPPGMDIEPFYDQSEVIDRTSATVRRNLIEGCLLVILVLFIFLRDVRAALIVAAVIPLSMLVGFTGMRAFGISANLMSLGAIDFGLIVDGAVVMMESFARRRAASGEGGGRVAQIRGAAMEVARPVLFGVLIIIAVYLPILTLEGLEGKMFRPMAITVCSALFGSLLLSLTGVPVVSSFLLKFGGVHREARWFERLRERYLRVLRVAMTRKAATVGIATVIILTAIGSVPFLGTEFMPRLDEGSILIETRKLPSVSLEESVEISTRVERKLLAEFDEISDIVTKMGRPDLATEAMGIYQGDVYVLLHPEDDWESGRSKEELIDALAASLAEIPRALGELHPADGHAPRRGRLRNQGGRGSEGFRARCSGPRTPGSGGAARHRGGAGRCRRSARGALRSRATRSPSRPGGPRPLRAPRGGRPGVRRDRGRRQHGDPAHRRRPKVSGGGAFPSRTACRRRGAGVGAPHGSRGRAHPLGRIAEIAAAPTPEAINHENGERRLVVQTNVRGRDVGSFVAEAEDRIAERVTLPSGYYLTWGGQFENQQRAMSRLTLVVPLSIAIIFGLLYVTFRRVRWALLILLNVPFAAVGGIAALWIRGLTLNLSASVGLIALFGIATLNGIVMLAAIRALREDEGLGLREAIVTGAGSRLKPVLMTATVASIGFLPMALSQGAGAEVQRPLATVVIGGIVTSTLLTLVVLPTLYERMEAWVAARAG